MTSLNFPVLKQTIIALALVTCQVAPFTSYSAFASDGAIRIAGQAVIVNRAGSGNMTIDARTDAIQRNLDNALVATKDRTPGAVNIVYVKGLPVITLGGYQIVTVDAANARAERTTPALLAKRWADSLRTALSDQASVESYIAQLSGDYGASAPPQTVSEKINQPSQNYVPSYNQAQGAGYNQGPGSYGATNPYPVQRGRVTYAPAGLTIPVTLQTSISTQVAKPGDLIQATINAPVVLGDSSIPAGSTVVGIITEAKAGGFMGRSGMLGVKFNRLRTPDGIETPLTAHIVGGIGKYMDIGGDQSDVVKGETWKTKVGQAALRGAIGAGTGAALGTAIGAIAGRSGRATGRGAWSGTAIGGGLGVADSLLLRKGRDVTVASGTQMQLQLDAPMAISGAGVPPYTGAF